MATAEGNSVSVGTTIVDPAAAAAADEVSLYVQCHCRAHTFRVRIPRSHFPLPAEVCHCDDCRQITGLLANDFILLRDVLRQDVVDPDNLPSGLRAYTPGSVVWYFCDVCGCHMIQSSQRKAIVSDDKSHSIESAAQAGLSRHKWYLSSGVVYPLHLPDELGGGRVFERRRHSWVRPGRDGGGLAQYMPDGLPRFGTHNDDDVPLSDEALQKDSIDAAEQAAIEASSTADSLRIRCRCGYVRLRLLRPTARPIESNVFASMVDTAGQKYRRIICPCHSCRTTTGFEGGVVILFTSFAHVEQDDDDEQDDEPRPQPIGYDAATQLQGDAVEKPATAGLCTYASSDNIRRRFCPCCGASIFIDFVDSGPSICDVLLGVVRAPYRAVTSSWTWTSPKLIHLDYCRDRDLARVLNRGWCPGVDCSLNETQQASRHGYEGKLVLPPGMS